MVVAIAFIYFTHFNQKQKMIVFIQDLNYINIALKHYFSPEVLSNLFVFFSIDSKQG
jgi:hypothetical protein